MSKVCKLQQNNGQEICVVINHIVFFKPGTETGSRIWFSTGDAANVTETPDEIMEIINNVNDTTDEILAIITNINKINDEILEIINSDKE